MWQMMQPYFDKLEKRGLIKDSRQEQLKQLKEWLPQYNIENTQDMELESDADKDAMELESDDSIAEPNQAPGTSYDFEPLITAIINNNATGDALEQALEDFRADMTRNNVITKGYHFDTQHLINAYKVYDDNFTRLANWDNRDIFWKKVIGYIQRQLPANFAQAYCTGLYSIIK